eukprot:CAMPEP_0177757330 /NCGR_PEP_ID=MMETSP0491_2-20121128/3583_1 /TAXON_ID=63592 /ORGANISM="Tetraselmis chuii, Strain PLY429" /LENGTH=780 /DNA_ID=CAMNT_0019272969 /DNA_START=69 /DNA_END=2411 /DNA_ORIENTATION=+
MADDDSFLALFRAISLDESTAKASLKNGKFKTGLAELIREAGLESGCDKSVGNLVYKVAATFPMEAIKHRHLLLEYITSRKITNTDQLTGAQEFLKILGDGSLNTADFELASGVGVVVTPEEIEAAVSAQVKAVEAQLKEDRYHYNTSILLGKARKEVKWAPVGEVKAEVAKQVEALLGPKTAEDEKPREKKPKAKAPKEKKAVPEKTKAAEPEPVLPADPYAFFPKPENNKDIHTTVNWSDGRVLPIRNTPEQLETHLKTTGGKVMTRFPPEPNGYLHIGHAKAMFIDFGMAEQYDGACYLRYDDTNPEAEKLEYILHIQDIVTWMGWKPWKITYSSEYFDRLYELAVRLIKDGLAYVCHQTKDEIEESRKNMTPSPWRNRSVEENLKLFEDMRRGLVDEGKATLRVKGDYKNENANMWDQIAYRIKFVEHPHIGDKWCIYPSYDFTHCLVDSFENVTHSLCTLEFESRRASYYWLLDVLGQYKPVVWEYSRLNITNMVMSKRKLNKLVTQHYVNGWDDPRLLTLAGLRRRGATPAAINAFCRECGITRSDNRVPLHRLEHFMRLELDASSPRVMAVIRPLKVVITNLPENHYEEVDASVFPGRSEETYRIPFTRVVYIERTDFKEKDEKGYYGLAPGKHVMLRYAHVVKCTGMSKVNGVVNEVTVEVDDKSFEGKKPPKGIIHWVAQPKPGQDPEPMEVRLYTMLFKSEEPEASEDFLQDLDPASLEIVRGAYGHSPLYNAKPRDRFQLERMGYFCLDDDSSPGKVVLNRTVTLRESK